MEREEKNKVIADKVRIHLHQWKEHIGGFCIGCDIAQVDIDYNNTEFKENSPNPDFFTPEGQAVLAGALFLTENIEMYKRFDEWLYIHEPISSNAIWLTIIEETKLAELFYKFTLTKPKRS